MSNEQRSGNAPVWRHPTDIRQPAALGTIPMKKKRRKGLIGVIATHPGSYQPSHELMLRFYSYFKQATEGPCKGARPGFWDLVGRYKYDAWASLGDMSADEAKEKYVDELRQIAETMSYTENVAKFMGSLDSFYDNVPVEDLELLWGPQIEKMRSLPDSPLRNTPLASRETSPTRGKPAITAKMSSVETSPATSGSSSPQKHLYSSDDAADEEEDEEFIDTVEGEYLPERAARDAKKHRTNHSQANGPTSFQKQNGHVTFVNGIDEDPHDRARPRERNSPSIRRKQAHQTGAPKTTTVDNSEATERIREIVVHLQRDLDRITARVQSLEISSLSQVPATLSAHQARPGRTPSWLPLSELSPKTVAFIIVWPFAVHFLLKLMERRKAARRLL